MPLEGLEVCVYQDASIPCVMTDSTGRFTIGGLPAMSDIVISLKKTGYRPTLLAIETGSTDMDGSAAGPYPIPSMGGSPWSSPVAVDLSTKGMAVFFAIGQGAVGGLSDAVGTMVNLSPAGGDGPYFIDDNGALDPSATSVVAQNGSLFQPGPGNVPTVVRRSEPRLRGAFDSLRLRLLDVTRQLREVPDRRWVPDGPHRRPLHAGVRPREHGRRLLRSRLTARRRGSPLELTIAPRARCSAPRFSAIRARRHRLTWALTLRAHPLP